MALKASLNLGLKGWLGEMFTDIKPVVRPIVKLVDNLEPYWISGFITAVPEPSNSNLDIVAPRLKWKGAGSGRGSPLGNGMFLEEATQASLHLFFIFIKKKYKFTRECWM